MTRARFLYRCIAVLAILLICTGVVTAADTIDFSHGSATIAVGDVALTNGDTIKIAINLKNLDIATDGSKLKITLDGFDNILNGLRLSSITLRMDTEGIDTTSSTVVAKSSIFDINLGAIGDGGSTTITKDDEYFGFNVLDMLSSNLKSVTLELLPVTTSASISLQISADIESTANPVLSPEFRISNTNVDRLTGNPELAITIDSGTSKVAKTYIMNVHNVPAATQVQTQTASPIPILGIFAGFVGAVGVLAAKRWTQK